MTISSANFEIVKVTSLTRVGSAIASTGSLPIRRVVEQVRNESKQWSLGRCKRRYRKTTSTTNSRTDEQDKRIHLVLACK